MPLFLNLLVLSLTDVAAVSLVVVVVVAVAVAAAALEPSASKDDADIVSSTEGAPAAIKNAVYKSTRARATLFNSCTIADLDFLRRGGWRG